MVVESMREITLYRLLNTVFCVPLGEISSPFSMVKGLWKAHILGVSEENAINGMCDLSWWREPSLGNPCDVEAWEHPCETCGHTLSTEPKTGTGGNIEYCLFERGSAGLLTRLMVIGKLYSGSDV